MRYGMRAVLNPELQSSEGARVMAKIAFDAFERKFNEDNIKLKDDLYVAIIVSDNLKECSIETK